MYKKLLLLSIATVLALFASGCIKYSTSIEVTKKDEVVLSQVGGISIKLLQMFDPEFDIEDPFKNWEENKDKAREYKKKGYKVKNYKDENFVGNQISKKYKKAKFFLAEDLPEGFLLATTASSPVEIHKHPFGTIYSIHLKFDPKKLQQNNENPFLQEQPQEEAQAENEGENQEGQEENQENTNSIQQAMDDLLKQPEMQPVMDLTIKIPKKAKEHNATSYNNKTHEYKWVFSDMEDVKNNKPVDIIIKYEKINFISILFTLIIIILTIVVVNQNKQYSQKQTDETPDAF